MFDSFFTSPYVSLPSPGVPSIGLRYQSLILHCFLFQASSQQPAAKPRITMDGLPSHQGDVLPCSLMYSSSLTVRPLSSPENSLGYQ